MTQCYDVEDHHGDITEISVCGPETERRLISPPADHDTSLLPPLTAGRRLTDWRRLNNIFHIGHQSTHYCHIITREPQKESLKHFSHFCNENFNKGYWFGTYDSILHKCYTGHFNKKILNLLSFLFIYLQSENPELQLQVIRNIREERSAC